MRGTVPDQLDEELARATGRAYVQVVGATEVVVGYDMRPSSPGMAGAFADGATSAGADVTMIGLASTDQLYFASGHLDMPGAMFTASHNPAQYNGIKMCRALAAADRPGHRAGRDPRPGDLGRLRRARAAPASITEHDVLEAYAAHLISLAPVVGRRLKVVVDAGNGMAGHTAPAVFGRLGATRSRWCRCTSSSTAPSPTTRPTRSRPANLVDLQKKVMSEDADIGLAFDGDADRCFLVDETGRAVSPSTLTALIASRELAKEPGSTVIHNLITSRAVPELVTELGGNPVRTRVGHSFIKATMAETDAIFGGEHSGHFYFRDFWRADSGMLAALHALAALAETEQPLSELLAALRALPAQRRDQLRGRRPGGGHGRARGGVRRPGRRDHRPPRRPHREPRRLDLQRAAVQHRAPAAAQRRGQGPGDDGPDPRRRLATDQERLSDPHELDPALLAIIVCPDCRGELALRRVDGDAELVCQACGLAYPVRDNIPVLLVDEARKPS